MRSLLALLAALASGPALAGGSAWPPGGVYCPIGTNVSAIIIGAGGIGIDMLDCQRLRLSGRRLRAERCFANDGAIVPYDTDFAIAPGGELLHDGVRYRRRNRGLCL